MSKLTVFQHVSHEHLGTLENPLRRLGIEIKYIPVYDQEVSGLRLEDLQTDALVFLGGPMSVNDEAQYDFIVPELKLIEQAIKKQIPILGICLGAQLIAKALGAKVYPGKQKEIGWYPLKMAEGMEGDPLLKGFPKEGEIFQWHGETFELPKGAECIASSELFSHQGFRLGEKVYGLQFHPEMTLGMVEEWLRQGTAEVADAGLPHSLEEILEQSKEKLAFLSSLALGLATGFSGLIA